MLKIISILFLAIHIHAHRNKLQKDADLQSALMPQELNPEFVAGQESGDSPWRAVLPLRLKRDVNEIFTTDSTVAQLKRYSRIVACVVLTLSALVEITVYLIETYATNI